MKKLVKALTKRIIKNYDKTSRPLVRKQYGLLEGWMSVYGNVIIAVIKIIFGIILSTVTIAVAPQIQPFGLIDLPLAAVVLWSLLTLWLGNGKFEDFM